MITEIRSPTSNFCYANVDDCNNDCDVLVGNEISGVHLVRYLQNLLQDGPRWNFKTNLLLGNTRAIKVRIEKILNNSASTPMPETIH